MSRPAKATASKSAIDNALDHADTTPPIELPVAAEPLPPAVRPATTIDVSAVMTDAARIACDIQPHALVIFEAHEDEIVRALGAAVYSLATCVEAIAKANT